MTRPFTEAERCLLEYVVLNDPALGSSELREQISKAVFVQPWFERSQSFDIRISGNAPLDPTSPTMAGGRRIGPGCVVYSKGHPHVDEFAIGNIILWIQNGKIESLEYAWFTDEMPDRLPDLDQLS